MRRVARQQRRKMAGEGTGEGHTVARMRHLAMKKFLRGWSVGVIATRFGLPVETVQSWVKPTSGDTKPRLVKKT